MDKLFKDNSKQPSKSMRRISNWLRHIGILLLVFAALAVLRDFILSRPVLKTLLLFQWQPHHMVCNHMERMVREATEHIPLVEVKTINLADPTNRHYIIDFDLKTEMVILLDGKRTVVLDKCWELEDDEEAFKRYISDSIMNCNIVP